MLAYNQFSGNTALQSLGHGGLRPQRRPAAGDSGDRRSGQCLDQCHHVEQRPLPGVFQHRPGQQLFDEQRHFATPTPSTSPTRSAHSTTIRATACPVSRPRPSRFRSSASPSGRSSSRPRPRPKIPRRSRMLQSISTIGGSTFPSSASDPTNGYKWCIGTLSQRQALLQQAFTNDLGQHGPDLADQIGSHPCLGGSTCEPQ